MSAAFGLLVGADVVSRFDSRPSEEAMYVAVTRAWFRPVLFENHLQYPLGPYVLGLQFVPSLIEATADVWVVATVCARLACRYPWEREGGQSKPLLGPPTMSDDPVSTWWLAIPGSDGLGVHYDELGNGTLVFLSVGGRDDMPLREPARV